MYRTIVIGYDGSPHSDDAIALAERLRDRREGRLLLVGVVGLAPSIARITAQDPHIHDSLRRMQTVLEDRARELGGDIPWATEAVMGPSAARALDRIADDRAADVIVLGSTHRHGRGLLTGRATVNRLMHGAPCAVAVAAPGGRDRSGATARICVAYDGSPEARVALEEAFGIARTIDATVDVVSVLDELQLAYPYGGVLASTRALREETARLQATVDEAVALGPAGVPVNGRVLTGGVAASILGSAASADLLVAGSRSYGPVRRVLAGSVSMQLLLNGRIPVLVTPRRATREPAGAAGGDLRRVGQA